MTTFNRTSPAAIATLTTVACLAGLTADVHADACYADTNLNVAADYQRVVLAFGNGGSSTETLLTTGGNPGSFLDFTISVNNAPTAFDRSGVNTVLLHNTSFYDPSVDGAIFRICYEEWAYMIQGAGDVQASGPVILQEDSSGNLEYFRTAPALNVGTVTSWERRAETYVESDFVAIDLTDTLDGLNQSHHPDFSAQGGLIQFGVFRSNNTNVGAAGYTRSAAMDSWSITVISNPCPADLNDDGVVNIFDVLQVLAAWGGC